MKATVWLVAELTAESCTYRDYGVPLTLEYLKIVLLKDLSQLQRLKAFHRLNAACYITSVVNGESTGPWSLGLGRIVPENDGKNFCV